MVKRRWIAVGVGLAAVVSVATLATVSTAGRRSDPRDAFARAVGLPLPAAAADVHAATVPGLSATVFWASAAVSPADFDALVSRLGLVRNPPVLAEHPASLSTDPHADLAGWWLTDPSPDADTYFALRPGGHETAAVYRNGRLYLRDDAE